MSEPSTDYHDYVFKNGRLVGQFEEMYRHSATVPWHQDTQADWIDVRLTKQFLADVGPFDEIHDLGCGLGNYLDLIRQSAGTSNCKCQGYDISETACEKARKQFPSARFTQLDLTTSEKVTTAPNQEQGGNRLFMLRGTLWYVVPKLEVVIENIHALMRPTDKFLVVQNFPPLSSSFIGKEVLPDHHALIKHMSRYFIPIRHIWYEDTLKTANDNWFIGLFSNKDLTK
jgi:SAM-dependent methyltransferase